MQWVHNLLRPAAADGFRGAGHEASRRSKHGASPLPGSQGRSGLAVSRCRWCVTPAQPTEASSTRASPGRTVVERRQSARDGEPFGWRLCATRLQCALSMLTGDKPPHLHARFAIVRSAQKAPQMRYRTHCLACGRQCVGQRGRPHRGQFGTTTQVLCIKGYVIMVC